MQPGAAGVLLGGDGQGVGQLSAGWSVWNVENVQRRPVSRDRRPSMRTSSAMVACSRLEVMYSPTALAVMAWNTAPPPSRMARAMAASSSSGAKVPGTA